MIFRWMSFPVNRSQKFPSNLSIRIKDREERTEDEIKRTSTDGILRTKLRNKSNILNKLEVLFRSSEFCFFDHLKTEDI